MTGEHAPEYGHCTLLWLGVGAAETEQSFWAVFSGRQGTEVRAHVAQVATGGEGNPLFDGGVLESSLSVVSVVEATHGLAILFDQLAGVKLGINHDGVERGVSEQGLDDVDGRVIVQVFGGEDSPAIVWQQDQRGAIGATRTCADRDRLDACADRLKSWCAGVPNGLDQIRCRWSWYLLREVPVVTDGHMTGAMKALHMANNLGDEAGKLAMRAVASFHRRMAKERIAGISRSRSSTVAVMRARVRSRALSKPRPSRECLVSGTVGGAKSRNGESGSSPQVQRSLKKVRRSVSQECAVLLTFSPVLLPRLTVRA